MGSWIACKIDLAVLETRAMPCEKCGADRIITKQRVLCLNCDQIPIVNTQKAIEDRRQEMGSINSKLSLESDSTDYNQSFGSAIVNRELAAKAIVYLPAQRTYAVREWLAYTYLLRNLSYSGKKGVSNFSEIIDLCRKVIQLYNEIYSLERGLAVEVKLEGKKSLVWTEREPLSFVPEEVYQDPDYKMTIAGLSDREINVESVMLQEGLMLPIWMLLLSEDVSRTLKRCYHSRILPFIKNSSRASKFVEISLELSLQGIVNNIMRGVDKKFEGLICVDEVGLQKIKQNLWYKFHSDDVKWYFKNLMYDTQADEFDLSCSIIVRDEQVHLTCLPLYSLLMLGYATMKWMKEPDLGRALNFKGEVVEDYFFRFVNAYDLSLNHPITGIPLIRVNHPELPVEIADIMGYDDRNVLLLECKFWNTPLLVELENQLAKFKEKANYVQDNLEKFGLDKGLNVVPFFYTPYAPYPSWLGIRVLPTAFALGVELGKIFDIKKIKLIDKDPELEKLFDLIDGPVPFPIDASKLIDSLPSNKYRLYDGLVLKYDKTEITVFIDLPISLYGFFTYLDISNENFNELGRKGVSSGDIIRMIMVNLNGTWTITQLLSFRKIMKQSEWESCPERASAYNRVISLFKYFEKKRGSANWPNAKKSASDK